MDQVITESSVHIATHIYSHFTTKKPYSRAPPPMYDTAASVSESAAWKRRLHGVAEI
jgi:hypothetical protein